VPSLLINDEKIKDPEKVAFQQFLSIAGNLNIHQVGKENPISFLKDAFPCRLLGITIIPMSEAEIKSVILSNQKTHLVMIKQ
jgi:hypothetical protein